MQSLQDRRNSPGVDLFHVIKHACPTLRVACVNLAPSTTTSPSIAEVESRSCRRRRRRLLPRSNRRCTNTTPQSHQMTRLPHPHTYYNHLLNTTLGQVAGHESLLNGLFIQKMLLLLLLLSLQLQRSQNQQIYNNYQFHYLKISSPFVVIQFEILFLEVSSLAP